MWYSVLDKTTSSGAPYVSAPRAITRAEFLRIAAVSLGAAAAACTPLRIAAHAYPDRYDEDRRVIDQVLRAFVDVVIPGVPPNDPNLVKAFGDPNFPFHKLRGFFVSDLNARARKRFRRGFQALTRSDRTAIVERGLRSDAITARIYRGAVFLAQVSFYAGIYDEMRGCPLIGFHGASGVRMNQAAGGPADRGLLALERTADGNPL
jgi:hypothetical protein